ncbi:hypothetical protein Q1695_002616 [Nippostrongylus brasiliensis]|nr:hypothetical protein Q1695_002616 [Nippostrongylus brasiliensis]
MYGYKITRIPEWQSLMRATSILGPVDTKTLTVASSVEHESVLRQARPGWSVLANATAAVSNLEKQRPILPADCIKDMFVLTGMNFVGMRRLRYNKPQSMLVVRTPAPPGAQANRQVTTGEWPDPWWDWLIAGARAALPDLLTGSYLTAALKGVGAGINAFLEERQGEDLIRRAKEHAQQRAEVARAGGTESEDQGPGPEPPEGN